MLGTLHIFNFQICKQKCKHVSSFYKLSQIQNVYLNSGLIMYNNY